MLHKLIKILKSYIIKVHLSAELRDCLMSRIKNFYFSWLFNS